MQPPGEDKGEEPEQIDIDALARQVLFLVLCLACNIVLSIALIYTRMTAFLRSKYCFSMGACSTLYFLLLPRRTTLHSV